jgi:hypothetical protein
MSLEQLALQESQIQAQAEQARQQMQLDIQQFAAQMNLSEAQLTDNRAQFEQQLALETERFATATGMDAVNMAAAIERMQADDARRNAVWSDLFDMYSREQISQSNFEALIALINNTPYAPGPPQPSGWAMAGSALAGGIGQALGLWVGSKI